MVQFKLFFIALTQLADHGGRILDVLFKQVAESLSLHQQHGGRQRKKH